MISWRWSFQRVNQSQLTRLLILLVSPDFVGSEIRGVEIGLCRVKDHTMDPGFRAIFVVLYILLQRSIFVDGKHIAVTCVIVEWISIDVVRGLFCS